MNSIYLISACICNSNLIFCIVSFYRFALFPPTSRDFQLDEKEPKNQENPNGQPTCNYCSADFLPARAVEWSGNVDQQIYEESAALFQLSSTVILF